MNKLGDGTIRFGAQERMKVQKILKFALDYWDWELLSVGFMCYIFLSLDMCF